MIGIDEAGRGPLAGPVVASAVLVLPEFFSEEIAFDKRLFRDSKTLSEKQREKTADFISISNQYFFAGIGEVSNSMIDRINILNASLLAMRLAVDDLLVKVLESGAVKGFEKEKMLLMVDGNRKIPKINFQQRTSPQGDKNFLSIAAASICAKVHRDKLMQKYHREYPDYCLDRHKGYGTRLHFEKIKKFGPCRIHRRSFNLGLDK